MATGTETPTAQAVPEVAPNLTDAAFLYVYGGRESVVVYAEVYRKAVAFALRQPKEIQAGMFEVLGIPEEGRKFFISRD